jgi:hypothetical protein
MTKVPQTRRAKVFNFKGSASIANMKAVQRRVPQSL